MVESLMLRIKRVATVVSNYQKEDAGDKAPRADGCGRNCLQKCCVSGAKLPLYAFKKVYKLEGEEEEKCVSSIHGTNLPPVAFLDSLLLREWEERMQRGLFRYDATACETKVSLGFVCLFCALNGGD